MAEAKDVLNFLSPRLVSEAGSDAVDLALSLASSQVSQNVFGGDYALALANLAAHLLEMRERDGAGGAVSSEKEGDLSRSYSVSSGSDKLEATSYGQEFIRIRTIHVIGVTTSA